VTVLHLRDVNGPVFMTRAGNFCARPGPARYGLQNPGPARNCPEEILRGNYFIPKTGQFAVYLDTELV
jgi:hypothetical protein